MSKTVVVLLCLLYLTLAHKDKNQLKGRQEVASIYEPFNDVPKPEQQQQTIDIDIKSKKEAHDHDNLPADKQQQYEDFNEMFAYGLVFGTILLALMLLKTCATKGRHQRRNPVVMAPATQPYPLRMPALNRTLNHVELQNRIQWHKNEIKRLEQESKELERPREEFKPVYNQIRTHETLHRECIPYQYQYQENIPVGRPLPRDNDSSFASEYPTL